MKRLIFIIFVSVFFISCGSSNSSDSRSKNVNFDNSQKDFLYNLFKTEYLWADEVQNIDYSSFTEAQDMINAFRNEKDKWSYSETIEEYENWQNQKTKGFGCYAKKAQIYRMKFNSPCEKSGLKRGDIVKKINGQKISNKVYYKARNNIGVESIFTINRNGNILNIKITPKYYKFKTVKYQIFNANNNVKIAHLIFDSFTASSDDELEEAFDSFKKNNVEELIVDLRYNGGGRLSIASLLLDKIAGLNHAGELQAKLKWNNNYTNKNYNYYFDDEVDANALNLSRVFFLTTRKTASASEMVINSLKPYMEVKLIGERTRGKPVGMRPRKKNGLIYFLINFKVVNVNNKGDYFNGIGVDCTVSDEYLYPRDSKQDALFKSTLNYIETGSCI